MHTKKSQKADHKPGGEGGRVSAYGQPDRKVSVFLFFDDFPKLGHYNCEYLNV